MLEENQHQTTKFCHIQMNIILLSIVLVTTGLVVFVSLQSRGPNTSSKLFFLPNIEYAQNLMPLSLVNTSPISPKALLLDEVKGLYYLAKLVA